MEALRLICSIIKPSDLPTDPFFYEIPQTKLLLGLHNYGPRLPLRPTYRTLQTAIEDVLHHIRRDPREGNLPMTPKASGYVYGADEVRLVMWLQEGMTWGIWGDTVRGLRLSGEIWEFVWWEFDVWVGEGTEREDAVGSGRLWAVG